MPPSSSPSTASVLSTGASGAMPTGSSSRTSRQLRLLPALPRRAARYVLAIDAVAVLMLGVAAWSAPLRWRDIAVFTAFVLCGCVSVEGSRHLGSPASRRDRAYKDLLSAWTLPVVLLLPPVYAVLVYLPINALAQCRVTRLPPVKRVFNTAVVAIAGYMAAMAHRLISGEPAGPSTVKLAGSPRAIGATLIAAGVFATVSACLVAGVLHRIGPAMTRRQAFGSRDTLVIDVADLCVGVLVAVIWTVSPALVVLAVPPVLLLQRTLLHGELLQASRTDTKTGLANPAYWRDVAEREVTRALRTGRPLAVLLLDIDHFKAVNDTCGHLAGDLMLAEVARVLQHNVRPQDVVGRFGGEEFAVLLPNMPTEAAAGIAGRLRESVAQLSCPLAPSDSPLTVTVSVGVATLGPGRADLTGLLAASDAALYRAKGAGRNQVVVADAGRVLTR